MESANYQIKGNDSQNKEKENPMILKMMRIISYISWLLLTVNSCVSLGWLYKKKYMRIWTIKVVKDYSYLPLQMYHMIIYVVFNFSMVIIFFGCVYYFYETLIKKDKDIITILFTRFTQFHFFPILCAFVMFTLGEIKTEKENEKNSVVQSGFAISLFGLISMIFLYMLTNFQANWEAYFLIKKGVFSCLIILFWYNICYDIFYLHQALRPKGEKIFYWMRGCGLAFSIIFGLGSNIFSFFYKDIIICFFDLLIYVGLAIYYYKHEAKTFHYYCYYYYSSCEDYEYRTRYNSFNNEKNKGDGIVDVIMICLSTINMIYLIAYHVKNIQKEMKNEINIINVDIQRFKEEKEEKNKKIQEELELIKKNKDSNTNEQDIIIDNKENKKYEIK